MKRTRENAEKLKVMLNDNQQFSVRNIEPQLTLSPITVRRILYYDTKAKFYRPSTFQPLTEDHKEQRRIFCNWLLQQPDDFVQQVIWTDEKIFVLNRRDRTVRMMVPGTVKTLIRFLKSTTEMVKR